MEESCLLDFDSLKVGDAIYCILYGYGRVQELDSSTTSSLTGSATEEYPLKVIFPNGSTEWYNMRGFMHNNHLHKSLYKSSPFEKALKEVKKANKQAQEYKKQVYDLNQENNELYQRNLRLEKMLLEYQENNLK